MKPMLARPAEQPFDVAAVRYVEDPAWGLDVKMDGRRMLIVLGPAPVAFNRSGEAVPVPKQLAAAFRQCWSTAIVVDGELMPDGSYVLFDMPSGAGIGLADPWSLRRSMVDEFLDVYGFDRALVRSVPSAIDQEAKARLVMRVLAEGLEGVIAKHLASGYEPGRRSPSWLKIKHVKTVDCVVTRLGVDGKANMAVGVYAPGQDEPVEIGEVSALTGDGPRVQVHDVVEVSYLYVGVNGRLVQPVRPILRTGEKRPEECTIDQLTYRKEPS